MSKTVDLIANKRVSRRGIFPFRFRGSCRLEPCLDGEVTPEIVQSAGGFDEGVLKARLEVAINVTDATEDLDSAPLCSTRTRTLETRRLASFSAGLSLPPLGFFFACRVVTPAGS